MLKLLKQGALLSWFSSSKAARTEQAEAEAAASVREKYEKKRTRKHTLQTHGTSAKHVRCMALRARARAQHQQSAMDVCIRQMNADHLQLLSRLFVTAYHVAKLEMPFTAYPSLVALQETNGLQMGRSYHSDQAVRRFIPFIFEDLRRPQVEVIQQSRYIAITVDASIDSSNKDLESVYVRYVADGKPVNTFVCVEELQLATAAGHKEAIERGLEGIQGWKEKMVALGTDGASVMVGRTGGLATLLREEVPYLLSFHCAAFKLELAALDFMNDEAEMKKVSDILTGIYKQYHYSPKAWRELKVVASQLEEKVLKPTNLGGTRWLPHLKKALITLLHNFHLVYLHFENTVAARTSSADTQGWARNVLQVMDNFRSMMFVHLVMDILDCLSRLSLEMQSDSITLATALHQVETTILMLTDMQGSPGHHLEQFLKEAQQCDGHFRGADLQGCNQEAIDQFEE